MTVDIAADAAAITAGLRARFGLLQAMAGDPWPWTRRTALVACTRLAQAQDAARWRPGVAELLPAVAVRETRAKLATGTRRPPRPGGPRPAVAAPR